MAGSTDLGLDRHVLGKIQSSGGQVTHTHTNSIFGEGNYLLSMLTIIPTNTHSLLNTTRSGPLQIPLPTND
jgi:hypothetical protein